MMRPFRFFAACVVACSSLAAAAIAGDSGPSALVTTTRLEKGSLPKTVTAYGRVEAGPGAKRMIMASAAAVVGEIDVQIGEEIAKGDPLIRLMPSPAVAASYAQAKSALRVATQSVARTRKLVGGHLATRQQLADAEKTQSDARAALEALEAQGAGGPRTLRAPFAAIVVSISASPGAIVAEGAPLLGLVRADGLVLRVGVLPTEATGIKPGDAVTIAPIGRHGKYPGKVALRGAMVAAATGMVPVDIALPAHGLLPGEMAEAAITTGETKGYIVPHAAILVDDRGAPYVVQAVNAVAKKVAVHILAAAGDRNVIAGPLDPSAPLVLTGNYQLENGMKVRLADPDGKAGR